MAYLDLSTFTQVDPNSKWTVATGNERIDYSAITRADQSYIYKDYQITGEELFGNYDINIDFKVTAQSGNDCKVGIFAVTNNNGYWETPINDTGWEGQAIMIEPLATNLRIYFMRNDGSGGYAWSWNDGLSINTQYYLKTKRIGNFWWVKIYTSSSDRDNDTNEVVSYGSTDQITITKFRYLQCGFSDGWGGSNTATGYNENYEIVEADADLGTSLHDNIGEGYGVDSLFIDGSGNIHVSGTDRANAKLYYQVSTDGGIIFTDGEGGSAGSYKEWSTGGATFPESSAIVTDSSGNIYLFYHRRWDIFMRKKIPGTGTGTGWGAEVNVSSTGNLEMYSLRVEVDSNDNLIVIGSGYWSGRSDALIACTSDDNGATWTKEFGNFDDAYKYSDLTIDDDDNAWYVHFTSYGGWDAEVHKLEPSVITGGYSWSWLGDYNNKTGTKIYGSAIIAERTTNIIWEFLSIEENSYYKIIYSKFTPGTGGGWSAWQTLLQKDAGTGESYYYNLSVIRDYNNEIYLTYNLYDGSNNLTPIYLLHYGGSSWDSPITLNLEGINCILQEPNLLSGATEFLYIYEHEETGTKFLSSFNLNQVLAEEPVALEEEAKFTLRMEIEEILNLSDDYSFTREIIEAESLGLSENIELDVSLEKIEPGETPSLQEEIIVAYQELEDIDNDFRSSMLESFDISNKSNTVIEEKIDIDNEIITVKEVIEDVIQQINVAEEVYGNVLTSCDSAYGKREFVDSKVNVLQQPILDVLNDFRMIFQWQAPGDAGVQSKGKKYIKVYIDSVEQTDVDVDSVTLEKTINASHTVSFILGRPYDTINKPDIDSTVEIKYDNALIYYGYIISISPTDTPESLRVNCGDYYWHDNKNTTWFNVGHKSPTDTAITYTKINYALASLGIGFWNIGNFIPQNMDLYGVAKSEAITRLVTECGNFGWFYDVNGNKKLWTAGGGIIVDIAKQELGQNIGLYQIIDQNFMESVDNIINRYKVNMGTATFRTIYKDNGEATTNRETRWYSVRRVSAIPDWDGELEVLAEPGGYGLNYHADDTRYLNVFRKFKFISNLSENEKWSDITPPVVEITRGFGTSVFSGVSAQDGILREGFSVDYDEGTLTLNEPLYYYERNEQGSLSKINTPAITLILHSVLYVNQSEDPDEGSLPPDSESSLEMSFITKKVGDYPTTILRVLNLGGLSRQNGGTFVIKRGGSTSSKMSPTWNDMPFAKDIAYWKLSNTAHKRIKGTIRLTLDAVLFYNLDLSKRIRIKGITEYPLNIMSMSYNMNDFTVTLNLEGKHYYKRTVSMPSHGEGIKITSVASVGG